MELALSPDSSLLGREAVDLYVLTRILQRCPKLLSSLALAGAVFAAPALAGAAQILDFESFLNGQAGPFVINTPDATVTITGSGPNIGPAIFDSDPAGPNSTGLDPDLLVDTGNILILQNNNFPNQTVPGIYDTPNDDEDNGFLYFAFSSGVTVLSMDLIDINGNGPANVVLQDSGGLTRSYYAPQDWTGDVNVGDVGIGTLYTTLQADQAGVGPGNPLAIFSQDAGFNEDDVVFMSVNFMGSAGLDNLTFVPEPSTFLLVAMGLAVLAPRRSRR
jgi:hypothetical protein